MISDTLRMVIQVRRRLGITFALLNPDRKPHETGGSRARSGQARGLSSAHASLPSFAVLKDLADEGIFLPVGEDPPDQEKVRRLAADGYHLRAHGWEQSHFFRFFCMSADRSNGTARARLRCNRELNKEYRASQRHECAVLRYHPTITTSSRNISDRPMTHQTIVEGSNGGAASSADIERSETLQRVLASGAVAVVRMPDSDKLIRIVEAIREGGVTAIEITMTTPGALNVIETVARRMGDAVEIGVGSVLDATTCLRAIDAGARYVVSPIYKDEVIQAAHSRGRPVMPGAFTPTEIQTATEAGADVIKVFPADIVGMPFFKAVLAPMPHLRLMPTGGVSLTNAGDWMRAGAVAVGVGSALLDKKAIEEGNYEQLTENARILLESVEEGRAATSR